MSGYVVRVKYNGKTYDVQVSDSEVDAKLVQFCKDNPKLAVSVNEEDIAEIVANDKIPFIVELEKNSSQRWVRGECGLCGAKHRMVTTSIDSAVLSSTLFKKSGVTMPRNYICEKCFEEEYNICSKCKRDMPVKEMVNGICSLCQSVETPLRAKRVKVT